MVKRMRSNSIQKIRSSCGWLVHILTASGAIFCFLSLVFMHQHQWIYGFWALTVCLIIDSIDGTLARKFKVTKNIPQIDGALLDNLVDYVAYVIVPCFFIYAKELVPNNLDYVIISMIILASSYQFSHIDAKTKDNFFRGFPSYWNFTVFYMLIVDGTKWFNLGMFLFLISLVFIPIKYLYLSRMNYVTNKSSVKYIIYLSTLIFGIAGLHLLVFYPEKNMFFFVYSFMYIIAYFLFSIYRTIYPLK